MRRPARAGLLLLASACTAGTGPPRPATAPTPAMQAARPGPEGSTLVPVPRLVGPIAVRVVYPPSGAVVDAGDSTFLLGSMGTGDATLTLNGHPVPVAPNGAWLGWIPLPRDSVMAIELVARSPRDSQRLVHPLRRSRFVPPTDGRAWIDPGSFVPQGKAWIRPEEPLRMQVRASPDATVRLLLPDGSVLPLVPDDPGPQVAPGLRAFDRDERNLRQPPAGTRFTGVLRGTALGPDPGAPWNGGAASAGREWARLEVVRGADTVRVRWPLQLALLDASLPVVELHDDPAGQGGTDGIVVGRAAPGATYHWFFANGTRARVDRRQGDDVRLRLTAGSTAWVPAVEVRPLPSGTWPPLGRVGPITVSADSSRSVVRIPLGERVPVRLQSGDAELTLDLFGAVGDIDWIRYAPGDAFVRRIDWVQRAADEVAITLRFDDLPWGHRLRWEGTDLLLEVRRPPRIAAAAPLRGRRIVLDPGHPPLGAMGPTGLREADANLAVALVLARLLRAEGATVHLTREDDRGLGLAERVALAERLEADVLVSIHNNALPDGVNPFTNHGTAVFYNHANSLELARHVQAGLVAELGTRDLGVARGDLALVRSSWMPAILTEGLFMIVPEHEAALRDPEGQRRYAVGVLTGLRRWLAGRGR